MMRLGGWLVLATIASGCVMASPPDHFYRLSAGAPGQPLAGRRLQGTVEVAAFKASGLLNERALLYVEEAYPAELHRQRYGYWTDTPARLLQEELVRFLRAANVATAVVLPQAGARAEYIVSGRIERLERVIGANDSTASIELELGLRRVTGEVVHIGFYRAEERIEKNTDAATVEAFNRALGLVYAQFLADIAS
jgi:ABC-type uncharacterized transport system auxiliary subunit